MASQSTLGVGAAAWYADPCDRHELRYWDGETWTGHVSDHGQTSVDPVVASAPGAAGGQPVEKVDSSGPETGGSRTGCEEEATVVSVAGSQGPRPPDPRASPPQARLAVPAQPGGSGSI
jgi:hypothetical protein